MSEQTVASTTRGVAPLAFTLHSAHGEPVLFTIGTPQPLQLSITNVGRATLTLGRKDGARLSLRFRPGVLDRPEAIGLDDHAVHGGWTISTTTEVDGTVTIRLDTATAPELEADGRLTLGLTGILGRHRSGSHGTIVALRYHDLRVAGASGSLQGSVASHMTVVHQFPTSLWDIEQQATGTIDLGGRVRGVAGLEQALIQLRDAVVPPLVIHGGGLLADGRRTMTLRLLVSPSLAPSASGPATISMDTRSSVSIEGDDPDLHVVSAELHTEKVTDLHPDEVVRAGVHARHDVFDDLFAQRESSVLTSRDTWQAMEDAAGSSDDATLSRHARILRRAFDAAAGPLGPRLRAAGLTSPIDGRRFARAAVLRLGPGAAESHGAEFLAEVGLADDLRERTDWQQVATGQRREAVAAARPAEATTIAADGRSSIVAEVTVIASGRPRRTSLRVRCDGLRMGETAFEDLTIEVPVLVGPAGVDAHTLTVTGHLALADDAGPDTTGNHQVRAFEERGWNFTVPADEAAAFRVGPSHATTAAEMTYLSVDHNRVTVGGFDGEEDATTVVVRARAEGTAGVRLDRGSKDHGFVIEAGPAASAPADRTSPTNPGLAVRRTGAAAADTGDAAIFIDHTTGNVGIGTRHPTEALHVEGRIRDALGEVMPRGAIVMWQGEEAPPGWAICNGDQGTPDLRSRFVVGAGIAREQPMVGSRHKAVHLSKYIVGHSAGTETIALSADHNGPHTHGVTDPKHGHNVTNIGEGYHRPDGSGGDGYPYTKDAAKTQFIQTNSTGISIQSQGKGTAMDVRPPWYALTFIMKL